MGPGSSYGIRMRARARIADDAAEDAGIARALLRKGVLKANGRLAAPVVIGTSRRDQSFGLLSGFFGLTGGVFGGDGIASPFSTFSSSTSKISVSFGPILAPAPRSP